MLHQQQADTHPMTASSGATNPRTSTPSYTSASSLASI
ncbi:unnamed protein product, partial [Rotaria sp. Silwood2]